MKSGVKSPSVRLGVLLPTRGLLMTGNRPIGIQPIISMAQAAEQAGLDSVWVGDSLTAKPRLEPLTTLAAVAGCTERIRLGTAVLLAALRHPVTLAQAAGTVDLISGGRLVLGVGVGGAFIEAMRKEWRNTGVDPKLRASRFEEVVDITKRLTAGESVTHFSRHFDLDNVSVEPVSQQPGGIPMLVACHWRAGLDRQFKRAALLGDGFLSISDRPCEYAQVGERVAYHVQGLGSDASCLEKAFYMTVNLRRDEDKATDEAEQFLMMYYGVRHWGDRWGPFGPPERTVECIQKYVNAGAGTIIVRFASFDQLGQLQVFLDEVVQAL